MPRTTSQLEPVESDVDQNPEGDEPAEQPRAANVRLAEDARPAVDHEILLRQKMG